MKHELIRKDLFTFRILQLPFLYRKLYRCFLVGSDQKLLQCHALVVPLQQSLVTLQIGFLVPQKDPLKGGTLKNPECLDIMTLYKLCKLVQITDPACRCFTGRYRDCHRKRQIAHTAVRKNPDLATDHIPRPAIGSTKGKGYLILCPLKSFLLQYHLGTIGTDDPLHDASPAVLNHKASLCDLSGIHRYRKLRRIHNNLRQTIFKYSLCVLIDLLFHGASNISLDVQA